MNGAVYQNLIDDGDWWSYAKYFTTTNTSQALVKIDRPPLHA